MVISMKTKHLTNILYNKLLIDLPDLDIKIMQDSYSSIQWIEMTPYGCTKYNAIKKN